jgi:Rps23 Pro-64 3,4-dihydroxylase Tpa1-like proline 4-hydroxylase
MDMVCSASRHPNHGSLALVPYKARDDVVMESLTAFQQKQQFRLLQQQRQDALSYLNSRQQQPLDDENDSVQAQSFWQPPYKRRCLSAGGVDSGMCGMESD